MRPQSAVLSQISLSSRLTSHTSAQLSLAMSLLKSCSLVVPAALRRLHSPALPHNIQELSSSQTRELASAQAARLLSSSSSSSSHLCFIQSIRLGVSLSPGQHHGPGRGPEQPQHARHRPRHGEGQDGVLPAEQGQHGHEDQPT